MNTTAFIYLCGGTAKIFFSKASVAGKWQCSDKVGGCLLPRNTIPKFDKIMAGCSQLTGGDFVRKQNPVSPYLFGKPNVITSLKGVNTLGSIHCLCVHLK